MSTHIGNRALDPVTEETLDLALRLRGFEFAGFGRGSDKSIVAIAVNGEHTLVHIGRDERDAAARLASLATRP